MKAQENSSLLQLALEKIAQCEDLINSLSEFNHLEGVQKVHRKIKQELNFLRKIYRTKSVKKEHLQCSNLTHFTAQIQTLRNVEDCVSLNKVFYLDDRKLTVDIVCNNGLSWVKVVARNPKSLSQICMGDTNYGVRSVLDQAQEFLQCAPLYPCLFQTPKVTFVFANGIGINLASKLESSGVIVKGDRLNLLEEDACNVSCLTSIKNSSFVSKLNLDVSAMLAYVSSVTNGSCDKYEFSVPVLAQQAEWECKRPVKPILDDLFKDKKLYCCQTAKDNFINILNTVGGPNERIRGFEFLDRITVLPDDAEATDGNSFDSVQVTADKTLYIGGKIRERSLIIFKFGDRIKAVTVTANDGFVRAAKQQGINFVVFVHESRALTEQKETKAKLRIDS